jgi:hypothetical protein
MLLYSWSAETKAYDPTRTTLLVKWFKYHLTLPLARLFRAKEANTYLPDKPKGNDPLSAPLRNIIFLLTKKGSKAYEVAWTLF